MRRLRKRALEQGRADDSEEAIRHRQEVYRRETEPLVAMYRDQGLLIEVDGLGTPDEVTERIWQAFGERGIGGASRARSSRALPFPTGEEAQNSVSSNFGACAVLRHVCTHKPRMTMRRKL